MPPPVGSVSMETVTETAPQTQAAPAGVKVFELSDAGIDFGRVEALKHITLDVHEGERIAVIGPSGAGKTTLFRMLAAVIRPSQGSVLSLGQDTRNLRGRALRRLRSEVLAADAHHTTSDLLTSGAVIVALVGVRLGQPWMDPAAAFLVAGFIAMACWEIVRDTARILGDRYVIDEAEIRAVVETVSEVRACHKIRTRGSADHVFLDLHVWLDGALPLHEAHRISHVVKDRLMARFPEIRDAVIHIEPDHQ